MSEAQDISRVIYCNNADALLNMAKAHAEQASNNPTEQHYAVAAVLMSCAALEAYINETAMLLDTIPDVAKAVERVNQFKSILSDIVAERGAIRFKYNCALTILTGHPFEKGARPYQDFDLLFRIRDAVMHYKLDVFKPGEVHPIIVSMKTRKLCSDGDLSAPTWLAQMATPHCAEWAVLTATEMIKAIAGELFLLVKDSHESKELRLLAALNVGSSRVDLQACKLEYSIVSPK